MSERREDIQRRVGQSLADHATACAAEARRRYGHVDYAGLLRVLEDRRVVRFPVEVVFDETELLPGEFAHAAPRGDHARDGYRVIVHPHFRERPEDLPALVAYHLVTVNYGDVATGDVAERFGAALLGIEPDEYYRRVCRLADELRSR